MGAAHSVACRDNSTVQARKPLSKPEVVGSRGRPILMPIHENRSITTFPPLCPTQLLALHDNSQGRVGASWDASPALRRYGVAVWIVQISIRHALRTERELATAGDCRQLSLTTRNRRAAPTDFCGVGDPTERLP